MSLYLAFDTATERGSVAVGRPGAIAAEVLVGARRHAAALMPAADEALRLAGAAARDLTGIVIADGPGSFTGLRIGFATVQGIVRQRPGLPVLSAPSLLATAWSVLPFCRGPIAALYDALRGEVYAALYQFSDRGVNVLFPPGLTTVARLAESLHADIAVGDGAVAQAEAVRKWTGREPVPPSHGGPRAAALIELVDVPGALRAVDDVTAWEPDYGRESEAQVRWERAHGKRLPDQVRDTR